MSPVAWLAAAARAPVYPLVGDGGRAHVRPLALEPRMRLVDSPRHATVLLVLGRVPGALHDAARRIHDQVSTPRGTIVLDEQSDGERTPFDDAEVVRDAAELPRAIEGMHRALMRGERASTPTLGQRDNPVEWKGVGPHGQGGEGMMGGTPYGRPMAMTGADIRDGLQLDRLSVPLGPFLRWLPAGACLDVVLQGDVLQQVRVRDAGFRHPDEPEPFRRAATEAVPVAELELARARHHLMSTADLLALHGLDGWSAKLARLAFSLTRDDEERVRALRRRLRGRRVLDLATRGVGALGRARVGGPVARAAGSTEDARADEPCYRDLGFHALAHAGGDADARWRQRMQEAAQSVSLARRAGERLRPPGGPVEGVRGASSDAAPAAWRELLEQSAAGQAFDAFVTTLVSLDLDPATIARGADEEPDAAQETNDQARGEGG